MRTRLVPLGEQDRSRRGTGLITEGVAILQAATSRAATGVPERDHLLREAARVRQLPRPVSAIRAHRCSLDRRALRSLIVSMRLNLAKIEAALLVSVRAVPALIGTILVNGGQSHAGFSRETDTFADDYRTLTAIAEGRAEAEHDTTQWRRCYPWLATATGENGANDMEGYEFGYGPAFVLDPAQVTAVVGGVS
ncbi:hypothetical protein AB0J35_51270 [Nonomuraea angiospora]